MKIVFYKYRSRPRENRFSPFLRSKSNRDTKRGVSFEKSAYSTDIDQGFLAKISTQLKKGAIMRTGLKKWQKTTEIYFSEAKDPITISTFNTSLKKRLTEFAKEYPELCKLASDDEFGCLTFEINKDNFTFRVMKPTSDEKRNKAREQMNKLRGKTEESSATISETKNELKFIPKEEWKKRFSGVETRKSGKG